MGQAVITTERVRKGSDRATLEVTARLVDGSIAAGMLVNIVFNSEFSLAVPIQQVEELGKGRVRLVLDCEEEDGADLVEMLNFEDETIAVTSAA